MKTININVCRFGRFLWDRVDSEDEAGTVIAVPARVAAKLEAAWDVMDEIQQEVWAHVERTIDENCDRGE
jgi:hypothetical protein